MTSADYNRSYYERHKARIKLKNSAYEKTQKGIEVQSKAQQKYRNTDASKEAKLRYRKSLKGKLSKIKSNRSLLGVARASRYLMTEKGKLSSRRKAKAHHLRKMYGITIEEYDARVALQNGLCEICEMKPTRLVIDHCHKRAGTFRGLLCNRCNVGIGMLMDSIDNLKSAILYLERNGR